MPEALRGDLALARLASLLQLAETESWTGWLRLPGGAIGLLDGLVVAATCGALAGRRAVQELFLARSGPFTLEIGPVSAREPLGGTVALVLEGVRLADEWERVAPLVLAPAPGIGAAPGVGEGGLDAELDGLRTVEEVVRSRGAPATSVVDDLLRRVEAGELVEVAPPRPARAQGPIVGEEPGYFEALEAGRSHLRLGAYDAAAAAFRAALAARPGDRIAGQNLKRVLAIVRGARPAGLSS